MDTRRAEMLLGGSEPGGGTGERGPAGEEPPGEGREGTLRL